MSVDGLVGDVVRLADALSHAVVERDEYQRLYLEAARERDLLRDQVEVLAARLDATRAALEL